METLSSSPTIDESARRDFEAAWQKDAPRPIADFLPAPEQLNYLPTLEELVAIDLEMAWRRAQTGAGAASPPVLEDYLERFPRLREDSSIVMRLLRQEFRVRHRFGDRPSASLYLERFPELDGQQTEMLAGLEEVKKTAGPPAPVKAGDNLGRYRLCAEHGKGGFGLVSRAFDETLGREVAVKQLGARLVQNDNLRARFLAEARIAAQLQHPGVVPVYDVGSEQNPYYTMKLVAGNTLAQAITRFHSRPLPPGEAAVEYLRLLNAFLSVVRTMAFAHSRRVIHRDLKPQNIILGEYGETIILDWGLAKVLGQREADTSVIGAGPDAPDLTQPGAVMGTPAYMAPEQAKGDVDRIDQRSDVFALGAILYQLMTGQRPFAGNSSEAILQAVIEQAPPAPRSLKPTLPRPLEAICRKAMAKAPARRYADAAALTRDLELFLADEPVSAYAEPWTTRLKRWARRRRRMLSLGAGGVVIALVLVVAWHQVEQFRKERDREAATRFEDARRTALEARELAKKRAHAGAFDDADHILKAAAGSLRPWPDLAELRGELTQAAERATRLHEFQRLYRLHSRSYYYERDDEALSAMKGALDQFGALEKDPWWDHLPFADLTDEQGAKLREDVHATMMLYAGFTAKPALTRGIPFGEECKRALPISRRAQRYKATQAGTLAELFCRIGAGELALDRAEAERDAIKILEPQTPTDFLIMGIGHGLIAEDHTGASAKAVDLLKVPGVHALDAKAYAYQYLIEATRLEPKRFWAYVWLGRHLREKGDLIGAGLAFHTCVTLAPDDPDGYIHRGEILTLQGRAAKGLEQRELWRRACADIKKAADLAPRDPPILLRRFQSLAWMGDGEPEWIGAALDQGLEWMNLERSGLWLEAYVNRRLFTAHWAWAETYGLNLEKVRNADKRTPVLLARARLAVGKQDDALSRAEAILRDEPQNGYALAVRGEVRLNRALADKKKTDAKLLEQARLDFENAWRRLPGHFQTGGNLARILELEKKPREALQVWKHLADNRDRLAVWQQVEALLACARLHASLSDNALAEAALEDARPHNLLAVEKLRAELKLR